MNLCTLHIWCPQTVCDSMSWSIYYRLHINLYQSTLWIHNLTICILFSTPQQTSQQTLHGFPAFVNAVKETMQWIMNTNLILMCSRKDDYVYCVYVYMNVCSCHCVFVCLHLPTLFVIRVCLCVIKADIIMFMSWEGQLSLTPLVSRCAACSSFDKFILGTLQIYITNWCCSCMNPPPQEA